MVAINCITLMLVTAVTCEINCDVLLALIDITKDDGRSLFITMSFIHQMPPLYFAKLMYADYVAMLKIEWPCFLSKR